MIENIKLSIIDRLGNYELEQYKPWFNDECLKVLDNRKQATLQWLQNPSETNGDNLGNIRGRIHKFPN
jgi:hypothetical protein